MNERSLTRWMGFVALLFAPPACETASLGAVAEDPLALWTNLLNGRLPLSIVRQFTQVNVSRVVWAGLSDGWRITGSNRLVDRGGILGGLLIGGVGRRI